MITAPEGLETWVEIRRDALISSFNRVQAQSRVPVCAVVKANAYGHGIVEASRIFIEAGANMLGVTRIDEARTLRQAGIDARILIMAPGASPRVAHDLNCSFVIDDEALVDQIPDGARVHLKIDTGMGRFGMRPQQAAGTVRALAARELLEGVMTHFPGASNRSPATKFLQFVSALRLEGLDFIAHAAGSAALLAIPEARLDMVRVGTLLYGQNPAGIQAPWKHAETFAWYSRVSSTRALLSGEAVGYGSEFRAKRPTAAVTLPIGWADGFGLEVAARTPDPRERAARIGRALRSDKRSVFAAATADGVELQTTPRLKVLGRIGMQATTFADPKAGLSAGDICRIPARRLTVSAAIPRVVV